MLRPVMAPPWMRSQWDFGPSTHVLKGRRASSRRCVASCSSCADADHEHAPAAVIHAVDAVDLEGDTVFDCCVQLRPGISAEHDGSPAILAVDRKDQRLTVGHDRHPTDVVGLQQPNTLVTLERQETRFG